MLHVKRLGLLVALLACRQEPPPAPTATRIVQTPQTPDVDASAAEAPLPDWGEAWGDRPLSEADEGRLVGVVQGSDPAEVSRAAFVLGRRIPTDRLWGAALTLILLIALLNVGARLIARFFAPKKV